MDVGACHQTGRTGASSSVQSAGEFIQGLARQGCQRLTIIRLVLAVPTTVLPDELHQQVTALRTAVRARRGVFEHALGLIWTASSVGQGGKVIHSLLIYDGTQIEDDIQRAHDVGCYWVNSVTEGRGRYRNINQHRQLHGVVSGLGCLRADVPSEMSWLSFQLCYGMGPVGWPLTIVGGPHDESPTGW